MYDVIILAAGKLEHEFKTLYEVATKAYLPIRKRMMVEYELDALDHVDNLGKRIFVAPSGPVPEAIRARVDGIASGGRTMIESLQSGIRGLHSPTEKVLVIPADIPLLCSGAVEDFLRQCEGREAEVYYSFLRREDSEKRYPRLHHTYVRLRGGSFCGGSLFLFSPQVIGACEKLFSEIALARKNPLKLAGLLGFSTIGRFVLGVLSIADLERRISALLGAGAVGIRTHYAEAGFNVDDVTTLKRAEDELSMGEREESSERN